MLRENEQSERYFWPWLFLSFLSRRHSADRCWLITTGEAPPASSVRPRQGTFLGRGVGHWVPMAIILLGTGLMSRAAARMVNSVSDKQHLNKRKGGHSSALCVHHTLLRNKFRETPKTYKRTSLYGQHRFASLHSNSEFGNDVSVHARHTVHA